MGVWLPDLAAYNLAIHAVLERRLDDAQHLSGSGALA